MTIEITEAQLHAKKKEFVKLGEELGLFNDDKILSKISDANFEINNNYSGDAVTTYSKGAPIIIVNVERCCSDGTERNLDMAIFREFARIANEIQRVLNLYGDVKFARLVDEYENCSIGEKDVSSPKRGLSLIDEVISEYTARAMIYRKYKKREYYPNPTLYARPENSVFYKDVNPDSPTFYKDSGRYSVYYRLTEKFSQSIRFPKVEKNDSMFGLCKASYDHNLLDNIFSTYEERKDDGRIALYKILGGMGHIYNIYTNWAPEEIPTVEGVSDEIEIAPTDVSNALETMKKVFKRIDSMNETPEKK